MSGCAYCGANGDTKLVRDHVVPRSRGGMDNAFNIVMACESCNAHKSDATATEWLGERCPELVREIESRVNARLKRDFEKRDKKPFRQPVKLYALTTGDNGYVAYVGEVISESADAVRMEVVDAFMFVGSALWQLSGELKDVPRASCRMFNDLEACAEAAFRLMPPRAPKPSHYEAAK